MRTGTRTGWWKWTGGLNVCSNTLLGQSCCEGQLWPHNKLNLEEEKMQVHRIVLLFSFFFLLQRIRELLSGSLNSQIFGISCQSTRWQAASNSALGYFVTFALFLKRKKMILLDVSVGTKYYGRTNEARRNRKCDVIFFGTGRPTCGVRERVLFNRRKNTHQSDKNQVNSISCSQGLNCFILL